ncbi:LacI family DNA-binding transcriptional regulator [Winogradskya humida]|uniref:LacI family transcriptional regulator n=2 Tax=Winogradskya humida TaxID=113566 RepID=A0ABQ4A7H5_9ACTN|nr:LacI family transcriptional regulator [Actinoplanes humidus]
MVRPATMTDIAHRAGVSRVAVSYALNDRPGVSDELRARIKQIAHEIGFTASISARAIHGAAAHAIGLVMRRPTPELSAEVFRRELISGIQATLAGEDYGLALQFADTPDQEVAIHRGWDAERRVDGVILFDHQIDDPRLPALSTLDLPVVVLAPPIAGYPSFSYVWSDEAAVAKQLVGHLHDRGHCRFARVSGPKSLLHTQRRTSAIAEAAEAAGLTWETIAADYTGSAGARATRRLLSARHRPTALVFDNDLMAVAALSVAREMGVAVPEHLSIIAWEDSALCRTVRPALTALHRDIVDYGRTCMTTLLAHISASEPLTRQLPKATLILRESSR